MQGSHTGALTPPWRASRHDEKRIAVLEEVIADFRLVLAKCDPAGVAIIPAIYVDLVMHLAMREYDPRHVEVA